VTNPIDFANFFSDTDAQVARQIFDEKPAGIMVRRPTEKEQRAVLMTGPMKGQPKCLRQPNLRRRVVEPRAEVLYAVV
jgi:hypothetical protein